MPEQRTDIHDSVPGPRDTGETTASVGPVPFDRLLSVAVLTPAQASLVAVDLLDAAQTSGDRADVPRVGAVTLTPSGGIAVSPPHADEGTPVAELLKQLVRNARRLPAHPRPDQLLLLHSLEAAAAEPLLEPGARARELEGALADTLGAAARRRLPEQLGALVDAFARVAPSVARPPGELADPRPGMPSGAPSGMSRAASADLGSSGAAPHRASPARQAPRRPPRRRPALLGRRARSRRVMVIVLVLAAVLAGTGYLALRGYGMGIIESLGRNGPSTPAATAPDRTSQRPAERLRPPQRRAVPALAGRHAGPVTGVAVQKTGSCTAGAVCPVKVTVHFRPASTSRPITWKVGTVRLCKRGITWSAPTTVTAQPGWTNVHAHSSVRVPKGRSLALIALTTTPARAQSRPVPVTGSSLHC